MLSSSFPGSVIVFGSIVTVTNVVGYVIAFGGVLWYNYLRMPRLASTPTQAAAIQLSTGQPPPTDESEVDPEGQPLLKSSLSNGKLLEEAGVGGARVQRKYTGGGA